MDFSIGLGSELTSVSAALDGINFRLMPRTVAVATTFVAIARKSLMRFHWLLSILLVQNG